MNSDLLDRNAKMNSSLSCCILEKTKHTHDKYTEENKRSKEEKRKMNPVFPGKNSTKEWANYITKIIKHPLDTSHIPYIPHMFFGVC